MNRKGEANQVGMFIGIAIAVIVGAILLVASAQNLHDVRNLNTVANQSISSANGTTVTGGTQLLGQAIDEDTLVVYNSTDDVLIGSGNWTIYSRVSNNGQLEVYMNVSAGDEYQGQNWNASYTYEPYGYATNSGARAIAGLIIVFAALAVAVTALVPSLKSKALGMMGK